MSAAAMAAELGPGAVVCVTGGSGFLGSWCVKQCLEAGFFVRTTTRSAAKAQYLKALPNADEKLKIIEGVDLLAAGAFDEAISGCDGVLHTASPYFFGSDEDALVLPAVEGTRNVLASCTKHGVKRVVLTSSTAAVYANYGRLSDDYVYTDKDWSPEDVLREKKNWYCLSKTLAEREAWKLAAEPGCPWGLTVMLPTLIFGPQLEGQQMLNTSIKDIVECFDGSLTKVPNACKAIVDVRDVAAAHVAALGRGTVAGQRFVLIAGSPHWSEIMDVVRETLVEMKASVAANVPSEVSPDLAPAKVGPSPPHPVLYDASPSEKMLGIQYLTVRQMVADAVSAAMKNGFEDTKVYKPGA